MKVVWFSWKDIGHPLAGGAEIVSDNIRKQLIKDGNQVTLYTARYKNSLKREVVDGVTVERYGNRYTVYVLCLIRFIFSKKTKIDIVIDEMNTLPFWAGVFTRRPSVLLCYQLAREVWYYQLKWPLSGIGYFIEPLYLRLLTYIYTHTMTESNSTAGELKKFGFKNTYVFRVGMALKPLKNLRPATKKQMSNLVFLGALRPMKRPIDAIMAFELAKEKIPTLTLTMIGSDTDEYANVVREYIKKSKYKTSISLLGTVSHEQKQQVLKNAGAIVVTSIKEGWGLIVTEAGSMGTPSVAYDADGLRDSVLDQKTGLLSANGSVEDLSDKIVTVLNDKSARDRYAINAWEFSKQFTFKNSYDDFLNICHKIMSV